MSINNFYAVWYGGWCEEDRELHIFQKFMKRVTNLFSTI